jgi:serine/threonine-protein kinase
MAGQTLSQPTPTETRDLEEDRGPAPPSSASAGPLLGRQVGKYRIAREIGRGGMGTVYEAVHEHIGSRAAIKVLRARDAPHLLRRFLNEARAVARVADPGLPRIFDYGQMQDGTLYLMMEYLEGESLRQRLQRAGGRLPLPEAVRLGRQIASAVAAAHRKGIAHRDLKPDNVIVIPDLEAPSGERAKVLDFGLARLFTEPDEAEDALIRTHPSQSGMIVGTPLYMSPEQCRGDREIDDRTDVYSLGVLLYQMLSGSTPFAAGSAGELIAMHLRAAPPSLRRGAREVPAALSALVHRMLAKSPAGRPEMAEVVAELERVGEALGRPAKDLRRLALPVLALCVAAALAGLLAMRARALRQAHTRGPDQAQALRPLDPPAPPLLPAQTPAPPAPTVQTPAAQVPAGQIPAPAGQIPAPAPRRQPAAAARTAPMASPAAEPAPAAPPPPAPSPVNVKQKDPDEVDDFEKLR